MEWTNADYMRARNLEHLNKGDRPLKELQIGDKVKINAPPGHVQAKKRAKKVEHLVQ